MVKEVLMEITSVKIRKVERENSRMKGIASVVVDNAIAIHDIRIIEGENGLFIAMPSRKIPTGEFKDIAHPINQEVRAMFQKAIFDEYEKAGDETETTDEDEE